MRDGDILCWLDADVETLSKVPPNWIDGIIGDAEVSTLQRNRSHSEIGFWAVRCNDRTREMVKCFSDLYKSDEVFKLREWHSAYAFDAAMAETGPFKVNNLSPKARGVDHCWPDTPLAAHTAHWKGNRKWRKA